MDKLEELIRKHLPTANVMQLASSVNGQPWVCTVHFYHEEVFTKNFEGNPRQEWKFI